MPPGRPSTRTASYFDDDELDLGVGSGSATAFGGGAYQLGLPSFEHMSQADVKAELRKMSKELRTLYKASLKEYKDHKTLHGHIHFPFVTNARKLAVKASKQLRLKVTKEMGGSTWKKASTAEKAAIKARWHNEQESSVDGMVHVEGLHTKAVEIRDEWKSHPAPDGVVHHEHHAADGTVTKYRELPLNHGRDMYKIRDVLHWCRQATSMLMTIATRSGGPVDKVMAHNVERARDLRGDMYRLRQHQKTLKPREAQRG